LEREGERDPEINSGQVLPKKCIKRFVIRRAIVNNWQADRLLFLLEGTAQKKKNIGSLRPGSLNSFSQNRSPASICIPALSC
jgi:hypothetical protein